MQTTTSPWLAQLEDRDAYSFSGNATADVVIVGAGIAGVSTAYQLLMHGDASVILLDAGMVAHGATGRNAGHVLNEFERPLTDIIRAFGKDMTLDALTQVESAWRCVDEMLSMSGATDSYDTCISYNGMVTMETLLDNLQTHDIRKEAGIVHQPVMVCNRPDILALIPEELMQHVMPVPHSAVLELLKTDDTSFIAVELMDIGCMNSALFCNRLVQWMLRKFAARFRVGEHTPVLTVRLDADSAEVAVPGKTIHASHVVLCTNGFKTLHIDNTAGEDIQKTFDEMVNGVSGYMTGYLDTDAKPVTALSYYHPAEFYITRRPYREKDGSVLSLTCLGGSDTTLNDQTQFDPTAAISPDIEQELSREMLHTYRGLPETAHHAFLWQGLMGYTKNMIRRVGFEPKNPVLLYNIGCNGVGILSSIYGSKRIRQLLSRETLAPSIFDPALGDL